jgi:hypothetical protein
VLIQDNMGASLAYNDDEPGSGTSNSFIRPFVLPYDGFYTILVTRYYRSTGETIGDYSVLLTLERAAQPGDMPVLYAYLDPNNSGTLKDDGTYFTPNPVAGDGSNDTTNDLKLTALLSFELPVLEPGQVVDSAVLDLEGCSVFGNGFDSLGEMTVYQDPYGDIDTASIDSFPNAAFIVRLGSCQQIDMTEMVVRNYRQGIGSMQFRVAFDRVIPNDQEDSVFFTDPRLMIRTRAGG